MKRIILIISAFLVTLLMTACGSSIVLPPEQQSLIDKKEVVYTQVNIWAVKNKTYGINYKKGILIPVNTEMKILGANAKMITLEYMDEKYYYYTYQKYTKVDSVEMMKRMFGTKKVDLSKFSKEVNSNINAGEPTVGMTRAEVLVARGYPPFYTTASLEANTWKFHLVKVFGIGKTTTLTFENDKVVKIQGGAF